jgi:hypothetical protein
MCTNLTDPLLPSHVLQLYVFKGVYLLMLAKRDSCDL